MMFNSKYQVTELVSMDTTEYCSDNTIIQNHYHNNFKFYFPIDGNSYTHTHTSCFNLKFHKCNFRLQYIKIS